MRMRPSSCLAALAIHAHYYSCACAHASLRLLCTCRPYTNLISIAPAMDGYDNLVKFVAVQCDLNERKRWEQVDEAFVARWQENVSTYYAHELAQCLPSDECLLSVALILWHCHLALLSSRHAFRPPPLGADAHRRPVAFACCTAWALQGAPWARRPPCFRCGVSTKRREGRRRVRQAPQA